MSVSNTIDEVLPGTATGAETDTGRLRSLLGRHTWIVGFVLVEVGLVAAGFILDTLGGKSGSELDVLNVVGGLLGAYAVVIGAFGALTIVLWGGYSLLQSWDRHGDEDLY